MNIHFFQDDTQATIHAYFLTKDFCSSFQEEKEATQWPHIVSQMITMAVNDDFKGTAGSIVCYPSFSSDGSSWIFLVGSGSGTEDDLRQAYGNLGYELRERNLQHVAVYGVEQVELAVNAIAIGNYRFDRNKKEDKRKKALLDCYLQATADDSSVHRAQTISDARNFARDLINMPPADLYPEILANFATELVTNQISVEVWDEEKIIAENMGGITAVGQGSSNPSRFIHLHYKPKGEIKQKIGLVGKGVTFDAGGLSLKTSAGMQTMRCDMSGSAAVLGVFKILGTLDVDVEVHGFIGAVENMCAANSYKLGDVLRMRNGKTVEVHNTDAEGRLVMADCLAYASELGVDKLIDIATLTGACMVALGTRYSGLFTQNDALANELLQCAQDQGEGLWRLPLPEFYRPLLKTDWADVKNIGGPWGGSITAALFLSEFVDGPDWAHIDIAGPAFFDKKTQHFATGGAGPMVETIFDWLES